MDGKTLLLTTVLAAGVIFYLLKRWWQKLGGPGYGNKIDLPVAPNCWPIIGHAHYFMKVSEPEAALEAYAKLSRSFDGPMTQVFLGPLTWVIVKDPKLIEALTNHRSAARKDEFFYRGPRMCTGTGVFTREGEGWKILRKVVFPLAQPKNIPNFQEISDSVVTSVLDEMEKEIGNYFDISAWAKYNSLRFFLVGSQQIKNFDFYPGGLHTLVEHIDEAMEALFKSVWSLSIVMNLKQFAPSRQEKLAAKITVALTDERRKILKREGKDYRTGEVETYIDHVMKVGEMEGKNNARTSMIFTDLLVGAFDTQSTVVAVVLTLLAIHQDYQQRAYEEVLEIFGNSDRPITEEDTKKMKFIEMCIKEGLRWCIAPANARCTEADIEIDGYFIPKNTTLIFDWFHATSDPKYWERPNDYYPEHFLPEVTQKRPRGSFTPFSGGARACPGQLYSYQSMKTIVASNLRRYHYTTDLKPGDLKFKYLLMRQPTNSFVRIAKRKPLSS